MGHTAYKNFLYQMIAKIIIWFDGSFLKAVFNNYVSADFVG